MEAVTERDCMSHINHVTTDDQLYCVWRVDMTNVNEWMYLLKALTWDTKWMYPLKALTWDTKWMCLLKALTWDTKWMYLPKALTWDTEWMCLLKGFWLYHSIILAIICTPQHKGTPVISELVQVWQNVLRLTPTILDVQCIPSMCPPISPASASRTNGSQMVWWLNDGLAGKHFY